MTITADITNGKQYISDGVTVVYTVPWRVDDASEIEVRNLNSTLQSVAAVSFSVSDLHKPSAQITLAAPLQIGNTVLIIPAGAITQPFSFKGQGPLDPGRIEDAFDHVTKRLSRIAVDASGGVVGVQPSLIGLYSDRPLASYASGRTYHALDVGESYISNGTVWELLPTGGTELGYAEITTAFNTASLTDVDIPGLSVTVVVGERPVILSYGGSLQNTTSGMSAVVTVVADGSSRVGIVMQGGLSYFTMFNETRVAGLTPGTLCTFKLQLKAVTGGTAYLYADAANRAYLSVRSA